MNRQNLFQLNSAHDHGDYDMYDDYDYRPTSSRRYDQYREPDYYHNHIDEIENSSPSPPERHRLAYNDTSRPQRVAPEEIDDYDDQYYSFNREPYTDASNWPSQEQADISHVDADGFDIVSDIPLPNRSGLGSTRSFSHHTTNEAVGRSVEYQNTDFGDTMPNSRGSYRQPASYSRPSILSQRHPAYQTSPPLTQINNQDPSGHRSSLTNQHGIRLRPVSDLPDIYRNMFKFGVFNAIQSRCFDTLMHTTHNTVISAPTGSGKTTLFELAIIRMLKESAGDLQTSKCVYMAPTKALCSERFRDWTGKFEALGIKCCELTGDTVQIGKSAWGDAKNASIIITTGEKWDSLTRHWLDHNSILSQIKLFLVDEVHILNESRGSTLEVVISRMKLRGSAVRFILVSATVPNIEDVANWVGNSDHMTCANIFEFGEEFRPCRITKHVHGFPRKKDQNDFVFQRTLDYKLFGVLQQHAEGKPILIFVSTRKGVISTAQQLLTDFERAQKAKQTLPWAKPRGSTGVHFEEKQLNQLAAVGIGCHHAGMKFGDRKSTEDLYKQKVLTVIVATSTLAVGVNLPAHTVVIKGVKMFQNSRMVEYSDLDIMQMIGRAGRPQFDKEGTAIILCELELEGKYKCLTQGKTVLESCLHINLSEHVNSEIGLGTITDIESAKTWLRSSFLFRRLQRNPKHYAIGKGEQQTWQERLDEMVMDSVKLLTEGQLVKHEKDHDGLSLTEFGDIMSKFYIRQNTMQLILELDAKAGIREILETLSASEEFSDLKIRGGEKQIYNKLKTRDEIRFPLKKVENVKDKVFIILQAILGGISLNSPEYRNADCQPALEAFSVFRHISRIARAAVEVAIVKKSGGLIKCGLEVLRLLSAKSWEDRPFVLRQVEHIGEKSIKVLAEHGITSISALRKQEPYRIESLFNRRPPFGYDILECLRQFPQYKLKFFPTSVESSKGEGPVEVELDIECGLVQELTKSKKGKGRTVEMTSILTLTSDNEYIDYRRIPTKALKETKRFSVTAKLTKPSQSVIAIITSENIAGDSVSKTFRPNVKPDEYPTLDTRPLTEVGYLLEGIDETFWDDDLLDEVASFNAVQTEGYNNLKHTPSSSSSTLRASDWKSEQLPNGNFACNHTCKDKAKCRHVCCREGVRKPRPKQKNLKSTFSGASQSDLNNTPSIEAKSRSSKSHVATVLDNLDATSMTRGTAGDLPIQRKQDLKTNEGTTITSRIPAKRKRPAENTNIKFSDERELDHLDSSNAQHSVLEMLGAISSPSPAGDFSDEEMDAIIRDLPLDDIHASAETSNWFGKDSPIDDLHCGENSTRTEGTIHSKRIKGNKNGSESTGQLHISVLSDETLYETPRKTITPCKDAILDLTLDDDDDFAALDSPLVNVQLDSVPSLTKIDKAAADKSTEKYESFYDPLAEFEAWLLSGAVEIVDS